MDKLIQILASKKPQSKIINNKQLINQQKKQYLEQQNQRKKIQQQQQKKRLRQIQQFYDQKRKIIKKNQDIDQNQIKLNRQQIKILLRKYNQPITLFGENHIQRYHRLKKIQKLRQKYNQGDNSFIDAQFLRKVKQAEEYQQLNAKYRPRLIEPKLMDQIAFRQKKISMIQQQKDKDRTYQNTCDQIFLWTSKVIKDWNEALQQKYSYPEDKITAKASFDRYNETMMDISSFWKVLKEKGGDKDMVTSIYHIMNCCLVRQYIYANDKYIELSIGNAPWPMGVAMLGITVKRNYQKLSHVLNQEMTRRWMQAIKRLISISQELYPNQDKLKMVGYSINKMI